MIDDLNICSDQEYFSEDEMNELKLIAHEINKILNGYIAYLEKRKESDD